jgi:hypothetical protein
VAGAASGAAAAPSRGPGGASDAAADPAGPSQTTARTLAWLAVAGQALFVAGWVIGGALQPGYDHLEHGVSQLAAQGTAHPALGMATLAVLGGSIVALGLALLTALPSRPAARFAAGLFMAAGASIAIAALLRLDCAEAVSSACADLWKSGATSGQHNAHLWTGLFTQVLLAATPFAVARAIWPGPVAPLALAAGIFGLALGAVAFALYRVDDAPDGLVQRVALLSLHVWVLIVAAGILHACRRPRRATHLVPLRPRDFFARTWTGEGELLLRPFLFWRLFPQRFAARREATWITDSVWRIDDESRFGDGRAQRRQMFCELVATDHVRITAADLPEGADLWLEEGGYRLTPFRMAFPLGPVSVPIRCHDLSYVEPDGTFVNVNDARLPVTGIPVARLTFRVRPVEQVESTEERRHDVA